MCGELLPKDLNSSEIVKEDLEYTSCFCNVLYSETWELETPKGLPKIVLNSKVVLFLRFISMY